MWPDERANVQSGGERQGVLLWHLQATGPSAAKSHGSERRAIQSPGSTAIDRPPPARAVPRGPALGQRQGSFGNSPKSPRVHLGLSRKGLPPSATEPAARTLSAARARGR